ncbi:MAG: AAA family ATPase [Acidobacteriaceae bacterium]
MRKFLSESKYLGAIRLEAAYSKRVAGFVCFAFFFIGLVLVLVALALEQPQLFRIARIFGALFLINLVYWLFLSDLEENHYHSEPELAALVSENRLGQLANFRTARAVYFSGVKDGFSTRAFLIHLSGTADFRLSLKRLNLVLPDFLAKARNLGDQTVDLNTFLLKAAEIMAKEGTSVLDVPHLIVALYQLDLKFKDLMFEVDVKEEDWLEVFHWMRRHDHYRRLDQRFWEPERLLRVKGIGKDWSAGYTPNLDKVGRDLTQAVEYSKPAHIYGHKKYIEQIEQFLVDGTHNAVVVGEPGVGRHAIIQNLAALINSGEVLRPLQYIRLIQIDSSSILSSSVAQASSIDKIRLLFTEAMWSGNVILVVNDIDAFFDNAQEVGRVNATEALLPFLKSRLKIIGLTRQEGFQATIGKNAELMRWFGKIEVKEPGFDETLAILEDHVRPIEARTGLFFTLYALKEIVRLATKLIQSLPNPEKSLEIMDAVSIYVNTKQNRRTVLVEDVQRVVTERTQIPVEQVAGEEKSTLINMEQLLHERIVGQDKAIVEISNALRRARSGVRSEKRPIGSFLFLGPTGVGKTETTKALAAVYFGSESRIIRLDMSEYQEIHSINRLIGDKDSRQGGYLTEAVIDHPFSIVLLDEIEKAHPKVLDLFLQVLDEGWLTDALGRKIDFTNTMVIATSNAGAELIRQSVKAGKVQTNEQVLDYIQKGQIFRPEFLNRFDGIVLFAPLSQDELIKVAGLIIKGLNKRLLDKEISIKATPELLKLIVDKAYSPEFGARPLRRFVQEHVENYIASGILDGSIKRGQVVELKAEVLNAA